MATVPNAVSSPVVFGVDWAKPGEEYTVVGRFTQGVISSVSTFGPIHKLIVRKVGEDDEPFHVNEFEDYDIEHPDGCEQEDGYYRCGVEHNVQACGVRWSLNYSGTPVTEPGEYQIQAWSEVYRGFEYTEHDGGLAVVSQNDQ